MTWTSPALGVCVLVTSFLAGLFVFGFGLTLTLDLLLPEEAFDDFFTVDEDFEVAN
jgi:hypothetical protein